MNTATATSTAAPAATVPVDAARSTAASAARSRGRAAIVTIALLGAAWNVFGVVQWLGALGATDASLMQRGMTAAQAAVYLALPAWMNLAFGIGVLGGLAGSLALALRRRVALPVLAVSMAAYVALFAGDMQHGLFDVMPRQLPILITVLAIAAGLLATAVVARRGHGLR